MPTNIEVKAKLRVGLAKAKEIALEMLKAQQSAPQLETLNQVDTFYKCTFGRLKLRRERVNQLETGTLIAYDRPDIAGPKRSDYVKSVVPDSDVMEEILRRSLGVVETVTKVRLLGVVERDGLRSRIHLDTVEKLGDFIEFEVMIEDEKDLKQGEEFAKYLCGAFEIQDEDHIDGAYVDTILANKSV